MDKRESARFDCQVPLMDDKREALLNSYTVDISKTGVGLVSARFIPVNTKIMVEISLSRGGEPVLVEGKVKWVEKSPDAPTYRIGMVFPEISPQVQSRIECYFK